MTSTHRTFLRLDADGFRYVLRPVYAPPRPGKPSRPVTVREVYDRRVAVRSSRIGGLLGALGAAVIRRLV